MRSLAQVQLTESSVVERVKPNLAKSMKAGHCTASVLFLVSRSVQLLDWLSDDERAQGFEQAAAQHAFPAAASHDHQAGLDLVL